MAKKTYLDVVTRFSSDISSMSGDIAKIQERLNKVNLGDTLNKNLQGTLQKLEKELTNFQQRTNAGIRDKSDLTNLEKSFQKISGYYKTLSTEIDKLDDKKLAKLLPKSTLKRIETAKSALEEFTKAQLKAKAAQSDLAKKTDKVDTAKKKVNTVRENSASLKGLNLKTLKQVESKLKDIRDEREKLQAELDAIPKDNPDVKRSKSTNRILSSSKSTEAKTKQTQIDEYTKQEKELGKLKDALTALKTAESEEKNVSEASANATANQTAAFEKLKQAMAEATGDSAYKEMQYTEEGIKDLETAINGLSDEAFAKFKAKLPLDDLKNLGITMDNVEREVEDTGKSFSEMYDRVAELDNIKRTVAQFFSLANAAHLLRRAVNSAFNAVKELDAAMTETAVVTDFSVGDMWEQLPRYTDTANKLGVTTLGAYETMTLFYQQGLDTNEAFELGTETMKMARIAGLDYAEATDKMTAALRGFNMELNQASAQRIADVYSELAAITAADTEEISSAMTKTASIANSANMEFETTSAFLSQIIETTRESAETAGTAMKTVIARFQELKKSPSEIGEIDGEIVDANKIETALRTVGVALRDASGQFRDLDDVFLELASKWDGLDTNTQRYIATIAAGSRQQSRFIAMMSNYDRTMELVNAAYASNGASQKQYEKTLESLESKLARLKNAWDEFVLGITNSELIKTGVDLLTTFLQTVNKLTTGFGGLSTTILRLGAGFGALKVGKPLLNALIQSLNPKSNKALGADFGKTFIDGMQQEFSGAGLKKVKASLSGLFINYDTKTTAASLESVRDLITARDLLGRTSPALEKQFDEMNTYLAASTKQQIAYNMAIKQGVPLKEAGILLTNDDIQTEYTKLLSTKNLTKAEIESQLATQSSLTATIMHTAATKIQTGAEALRKKGIISSTMATWLQTKSMIAAKIAMLGMAAAAAIAVAIIARLIKQANNNSLEKRMERAAEATEKTKEAADNARQAYDELKDTITSLEEGTEALDTLIQGTDAWRGKIAEINAEVTKLLEQFPELAKFVTFDSSTGMYTINEAGLAQAEQKLAEQALNATSTSNATATYDRALQNEKALGQIILQTAIYDEIDFAKYREERKLTQEEAEILATEYAKNPALLTNLDELDETIGRLGLDQVIADYIKENIDNRTVMQNLLEGINNNSQVTELLTQAYTSNVLDNAGITGENKDYYNIALAQTDTYKNQLSDYNNNPSKLLEEYRNDLIQQYGDSVRVNVTSEGINVSYLPKGKTKNKDRESFNADIASIAADYAAKNTVNELKEIDVNTGKTGFEKMDDELAAAIKDLGKLIYGEGTTLTTEQTALMRNAVLEAKTQGYDVTNMGGLNADSYGKVLAALTFEELTKLITNTGGKGELGSGATKAIEAKQTAIANQNADWVMNRSMEIQVEMRNAQEALELTDGALQAYTQHLTEQNPVLAKNEDLLHGLVTESLQTEKAFTDIITILEDEKDVLEDVGSPKYYQAIERLFSALKGVMNFDNLSASDLTPEHLELIKEAANGSTESLIQLRKELALLSLEKMDLPTDEISALQVMLQGLDGFTAEAGMTMDDTEVLTKLQNLVISGKASVEELNKIMNGFGYTFDMEYEDVPAAQISWKEAFEHEGIKGAWKKLTGATIRVPKSMSVTALGQSVNDGLNNAIVSSGGSSSGGSSGGKEEVYSNSYDKLYNTMEDLNELTRDRNKLEREYTNLLNKSNTSAADLVENLQKQISNLEAQAALQREITAFREQQIRDTLTQNSDLSQYATYNFEDMTIEINWDAINSVTDADKGQRIEDYIGDLEKLQDQMDEANDELAEIQNEIIEFAKQFEEQYMDFEERVLNAIVQQYQNEIDELSAINDSINSANEELLSSINDTLSKQRQERDNEKTENELGEMQRRLDYLRQDTSGANALEIKQLEKQLAEAQEDYTDTLIDQKISELEEQNEQAAEQRERQILFAEAQLEAQQKTGELWDKVYALMDNGIDENGIIVDSSLWNILADNDEFIGKSFFGQQNWAGTLADQVDDVIQFLKVFNSTEQALARGELTEGSEITFKTADNKEITGKVDEKGNVMVDGKTYTDVYRGFDGGWVTNESYESLGTSQPATPSEPTPPVQEPKEVKVGSRINAAGATIYTDSYGSGGDTQYYGSNPEYIVVAENRGYVAAAHVSQPADIYHAAGWFKKGDVTAYKTGGLADFTGPAWLDGTKARPELVLNQQDTQNFIQLKDILADVMKRGLGSSENNEEVLFDIDINIEKVESQEDIDNLLNELERRITSHARYRNVNALTLKR